MARIFNEENISFKLKQSPIPEFSWHTSQKLSEIVTSKHLKFDIRLLDPSKYSYPYHFHRNAEELFVILSGKATLRTPYGFTELKEGDIVFFEIGPQGAHQLYNHTQQPCRFLDIRTDIGIDVCEYPDSGKINILPYGEVYQSDERVDYYKGEENVKEKWALDNIRIVSIKDMPEYKEYAVNYIEENWPPVKSYFENVLNESIATEEDLPKCFLMLRDKNIIGCYQLFSQEIIVNNDLSPWISCVFIDRKERGKRLSSQLLLHGRTEAGKLDYDKVYLTTDHIQFYEKFGFREIGLSNFTGGRPTKIYEHDTIK